MRIFEGAEFKNGIFCAQTTPSLCFGLIFVRGKLNRAKLSGLNFRKHRPLPWTVQGLALTKLQLPEHDYSTLEHQILTVKLYFQSLKTLNNNILIMKLGGILAMKTPTTEHSFMLREQRFLICSAVGDGGGITLYSICNHFLYTALFAYHSVRDD